ncbi:MAG TPA: hypothetical protein VJN70_07080 [Gemmatimonadaceae bacterium]|nr:hypothetical protein [Gemmatimonadaceae bacterium]
MSPDASPTSGNKPLQFDVAESSTASRAQHSGMAAATCKACSRPIASTYFQVNSAIICEPCRASLDRPRGTRFTRGLHATGLGLLAAIAGSLLYFAVAALTGREFALVALAVGFMVGKAVRKGSRGRGGWAYQSLAVGLTYLAIVSSYVPLIAKEFQKNAQPTAPIRSRPSIPTIDTITISAREPNAGRTLDSSAVARADSGFAVIQAGSPASTSHAAPKHLGAGTMLLGAGSLVLLAAAIPIFAGLSNTIGLLFIGIAVCVAWWLNRRVALDVAGPYRVTGGAQGDRAVA